MYSKYDYIASNNKINGFLTALSSNTNLKISSLLTLERLGESAFKLCINLADLMIESGLVDFSNNNPGLTDYIKSMF
jgi:hypothetical protein